MWSFFDGSTAVTCWYCHEKTRLPTAASKANWHCTRCDNQNILDAHGSLVDSRTEMYRESPLPAKRPELPHHQEEGAALVFCASCQRNQELVRQILSAYLPDEDDPEYQSRFETADEYADSLRRRYPMVCRTCQIKVDARLRAQAQWMYRRDLGSALHRSDNVRKTAPRIRPQPSLRRKGLVFTWVVCTAAALAGHLAAWAWYVCALAGYVEPIGRSVGLGLALLTYLSRMLNPLWLYIAYNPGRRAAGLSLYKRQIAWLSLLRVLAALLQSPSWRPAVWSGILLSDLVLCWRAATCLGLHSGRRQISRAERSLAALDTSSSPSRPDAASTERDAQLALSSLRSLSFNASEMNMDQDDTFADSAFSSALGDPWGRRPSTATRRHRGYADSSGEEDSAANTDILADLNTLSFGAARAPAKPAPASSDAELAALLGGGGPSMGSVRAPPRPFEPFAFTRDVSTGLETKMSAFSIDDGSDQCLFGSSVSDGRVLAAIQRLLSPGPVVGVCVAGTWVLGELVPLVAIWAVRAALLMAVLATTVARAARSPLLRCILGSALLAALACAPAWFTLSYPAVPVADPLSAVAWPEPPTSVSMLSQWPAAKQRIVRRLLRHVAARDESGDVAAVPLSIQLDCAAELASIVFLTLAYT